MTAEMSERKCTQLSPLNQIISTTCFARGKYVYKLYKANNAEFWE